MISLKHLVAVEQESPEVAFSRWTRRLYDVHFFYQSGLRFAHRAIPEMLTTPPLSVVCPPFDTPLSFLDRPSDSDGSDV